VMVIVDSFWLRFPFSESCTRGGWLLVTCVVPLAIRVNGWGICQLNCRRAAIRPMSCECVVGSESHPTASAPVPQRGYGMHILFASPIAGLAASQRINHVGRWRWLIELTVTAATTFIDSMSTVVIFRLLAIN
jgi:hypothetical protein